MDSFENTLQDKFGEAVKTNAALKNFTTMHVGGVADYLIEATDVSQLVSILKLCLQHQIPYLVLGGGSNVIISDAGFPGIVIVNRTSNISFILDKSQVIADAGCIFARVITEAASRGLSGIEWAFGLPGTIGGAAHNNVETWGQAMNDVVKSLTMFFPEVDGSEPKVAQVESSWMDYRYRSSKLKSWQGEAKPVILTITLQLRQGQKDEILRRMQESKQGRWDLNQPRGISSAGSFFKNPGGPSHAGAARRPEDSAGWLLDQIGAKKMRVGGAAVAKQHANFLVNTGNASAQDLHDLADQLKTKVEEKFHVQLEEEVQYLGVWSKSAKFNPEVHPKD